jgi:predicted XRE-type DNA-binding protein
MAKRIVNHGFIEASSGNVLADLGLPDAEELDTKLRLAVELNRRLKLRRLSQVRAAMLLGISQPKVSALKHYKLDGFSVERLMVLLTAMGLDVEIRIKAHRTANSPGRILVEAA